jgi:hypothetical protein
MAVAEERFQFDVQFFGTGSLSYTDSGGRLEDEGTLANNVKVGAGKKLAAGTQWVVDLANTVTWTLTGQSSWSADSVINASLTQPLLRGASRKVVLEDLTQAERNFLAAVRQMVLFQQGHYASIVTGSAPQYSGARNFGSGFYGLLSEQIQIQNQRHNIIGLEDNLNRFIEMFSANQVSDITQIEETRQNLLSSQSNLLTQINRYQGNVETYIRSLGLPPDLKVSINDPLLEQFQLTTPELTALMEEVADLLVSIRKKDEPLSDDLREKTKDVIRRAGGEMVVLGQDLDILQRSMPKRIDSLKSLETALAERLQNGERINPIIYDTQIFEDRITKLRTQQIPQNLSRLQAVFTVLNVFVNTEEQELREMIRTYSFDEAVQDALKTLNIDKPAEGAEAALSQAQQELEAVIDQLDAARETLGEPVPDPSSREEQRKVRRIEAQKVIADLRRSDEYREWVRRVFSAFQRELLSLSLMQTRTRLDSMTLVPISVTADEAFLTASEQHLDWMNEKAKLVDEWRQIDIQADKLKGILNLKLTGKAGTVDQRGVRFGRDKSEVQAQLMWDSPLNRYTEMMDYRTSQIKYQNARRAYYMYVDAVQANLRNLVRNLEMSQINFEINRNEVLVGTVRVDIMQIRMEQPPQRGGRIDTDTSRQLISALDGLLRSQNSLLTTWVNYQTQRMHLDFGMGTMKLDGRGRWIDPGDLVSAPALVPAAVTPLPLPLPAPQVEAPKLNRRYIEEE